MGIKIENEYEYTNYGPIKGSDTYLNKLIFVIIDGKVGVKWEVSWDEGFHSGGTGGFTEIPTSMLKDLNAKNLLEWMKKDMKNETELFSHEIFLKDEGIKKWCDSIRQRCSKNNIK